MRANAHQVALARFHPIFDAEMMATTRTEGRFGLSKKPKGDDFRGLIVREFRQLNETAILMLDVTCDLIAKFNEIFERNNPPFEQWRLRVKSWERSSIK